MREVIAFEEGGISDGREVRPQRNVGEVGVGVEGPFLNQKDALWGVEG